MKVDQLETPYLYLDDAEPVEGESCAAIHPKYLPTHVPHASGEPIAPGPYSMPVADLRHALGLLETDEEGLEEEDFVELIQSMMPFEVRKKTKMKSAAKLRGATDEDDMPLWGEWGL